MGFGNDIRMMHDSLKEVAGMFQRGLMAFQCVSRRLRRFLDGFKAFQGVSGDFRWF